MTREILFFDPAIHSKLGQDRHHLSCRARLRPSCIVSTASRILPRVTMSRTALERSLLCSFVSSFKKSKFSRSIRILIVFVIWLSPVSASIFCCYVIAGVKDQDAHVRGNFYFGVVSGLGAEQSAKNS